MLTVEQIDDGTVIDHIPPGKGLTVLSILSIDENFTGRVALVMNVTSKRMGKKDIVKAEGTFLDEKTTNKIALLAPNATVNIIKGGKVVEKNEVELPNEVAGAFVCPNPRCITNSEQTETHFILTKRGLCCKHCERCFSPEELAK